MTTLDRVFQSVFDRVFPPANQELSAPAFDGGAPGWTQTEIKSGRIWGFVGYRLAVSAHFPYFQELVEAIAYLPAPTTFKFGIVTKPQLDPWMTVTGKSTDTTLDELLQARRDWFIEQGNLHTSEGFLVLRREVSAANQDAQLMQMHNQILGIAYAASALATPMAPADVALLDLGEPPIEADSIPPTDWVLNIPCVTDRPSLFNALRDFDSYGTGASYSVWLTAQCLAQAQAQALDYSGKLAKQSAGSRLIPLCRAGTPLLLTQVVMRLRSVTPADDRRTREQMFHALRRHGIEGEILRSTARNTWPSAREVSRWHLRAAPDLLQQVPVTLRLPGTAVDKGGVLLQADTGELRGFNPLSEQCNKSTLIVGTAGSGKHFVAKELLVTVLAEDGCVAIIDEGANYRHMADAMGGSTITVGAAGPQGLDPLPLLQAESDLHEMSGLLAMWLCQLAGVVNDAAHSVVEWAIVETWRECQGTLTLARVQRTLAESDIESAEAVAAGLAPYIGDGEFAFLFKGPAPVCDDNKFTVVDLAEWEHKPMLRIITQTVMLHVYRSWADVRQVNTPKLMLVDNFDNMLDHDGTLVGQLIRRLRGKNAGLLTMAYPFDFQSQAATHILSHIGHVLILHMHDESIAELQNLIGLTDDDCDQLRTLRTRDNGSRMFLIPYGKSGAGPMTLKIDPLRWNLLSAKPVDVQRYWRVRQAGGTVLEALRARGPGRNGALDGL